MARGRLRIYLGAAPGVGKTVAMLAEGARRASRGTDVVVGWCETHDRPHTSAMLTGLEVIPRREVAYRGSTMTELDLDAILARRPQVALIDELAHTNIPGSRHEKRWQDVQELIAAGIDVISTVNIQHLESLNDAVEQITGITQQETVPDGVVRAADQIELVDMSPEALRRRMAHGNVYRPDRVDAALSNYFRVGNLSALRELALLWLADRVDEGIDRYREDHRITESWPTRERVVVAVSGAPEGETLLRRGARISSRGAGGELHVVCIVRRDGLAGVPLPAVVHLRRLTEELGGVFHTVTGEDIAESVLDFARGVNASQVLIGSSRRSRWRTLFSRGTGEEIIARSGDIDVHVVTHSYAAKGSWRPRSTGLPRQRVRLGAALSLAGPAVLTGLLALTQHTLGLPLIVQLYLLLTVGVALVGGLWPAVVTAVASSLLINWFFTPPLNTLTIAGAENAAALVVFVLIAVAVSTVVHRSARRAAEALEAQQESNALAELTHTLLGSTDQLALLLDRALEMFAADSAAIVRHGTEDHPDPLVLMATDGFPAVLPDGPEVSREEADDEHDLVLVGRPLAADRQRLLAAYAVHAGAVLHRRALQQSAREAAVLARDNKARTALLSAVSHDLRTPLAGIKAAIGSLRSKEVTFSPEDEAELQAVIEDGADRLEALIDNLLAMSRLQAGALAATPREVDLGEVIPPCVAMISDPARVQWSLGEGARTAYADPGLLDRVLHNLVENALRHQPTEGTVSVATSVLGDRIETRVVDTGDGVPSPDRDRIFRPFQRLGDVPDGDGVGLGLAVARGLTEAMGGTLVAEDTPGGGLTMIVSLPRHAETEPEPAAEPEPTPEPGPAGELQPAAETPGDADLAAGPPDRDRAP